MIPKECKRLAEVDFPIAVVSKHAAREKSIRHGHPRRCICGGRGGHVGVRHRPFRWKDRRTSGMLAQKTLEDIIQRIVGVAQPEKIILFGSAARGDMRPHSDVDLLVIKDGVRALDLMRHIYRKLRGVRVAIDVVVVSPADVARYKDSHALVIKPALREGRVVYESA